VKDRGLDVSEDDALEKLKKRALNQQSPVEIVISIILLTFRQDPGDDGLVGLLVQFRELHGVDLVVPAPDACGVKYLLDQGSIQ
jgi:hypothetical protein